MWKILWIESGHNVWYNFGIRNLIILENSLKGCMTVFIWFGSTDKAKYAASIFGAILLISLVFGGVQWFRDSHIQRNYHQVTAVVTDNFISQDRRDSWSDIQFEFGGQVYTVRHENFWFRGSEIEILVNTENPQQTFLVSTMGARVMIAMLISAVFGAVFLLYGTNFLYNRRRDRKYGVQPSL
jgi:hypothetical protein